MNAKSGKPVKKKLCWNCEGSASFQDENCPYCGVYLSPLSISGNGQENHDLSPPYKIEEETHEIPSAPYAAEQEEAESDKVEENNQNGVRAIAMTMALLLFGIVLFIFSFALLFFSHKGVFTLQWNGDLWMLYLLAACPMLFFGWRSLQKIKD